MTAKSGGGKTKSGITGIRFWRLAGGNLSDGGLQFVGSSWAEKMIMLRLKSGGMGLFNNLFICFIIL